MELLEPIKTPLKSLVKPLIIMFKGISFMTLKKQELKLFRTCVLVQTQSIQERTGLSLPTIRKYLNGDVYHPTAVKVFRTAKEIIDLIEQ